VTECNENNNGIFYWTVNVLPPCTFTLSGIIVELPAKGGSLSVKVITQGNGCAWTAVSNDSFIALTSGSSGSGNGMVRYTVPPNTNTVALVGTMTIAGQTFTVIQAIGGCTYSISPKKAKAKAAGGSSTVKVTPNFTDCEWTAVSNNPFITITNGMTGTGKGSVSYTIASNTDTVARIGTMTIASQTFTAMQAAAACEFSFSETNASFSAVGGSSNLTVTANGTNCAWKAAVRGSFIKITSGTSGAGDGTVDYVVDANTKTAARKGTITVGKERLTITQSGAP